VAEFNFEIKHFYLKVNKYNKLTLSSCNVVTSRLISNFKTLTQICFPANSNIRKFFSLSSLIHSQNQQN